MDLGTLVGIIVGLTLILGAMVMGGGLIAYYNLPSLMIVFGGTIASTLITFPLGELVSAFRAAWEVLRQPRRDLNEVVKTMIRLTNLSRQQGLLALSQIKTTNRFLHKVAQLLSDGASENIIRETMRIEIESLKLRHQISQDVFRKMAAYAPAFGMLGTLIGLVQMLKNMSDPQTLGPAMAVALLTTLYGSFLSTLVFLPISGKLKSRTDEEVLTLEIIFEGAICILDNNNPIVVYEKLSSFIAPRRRQPIDFRQIKKV